jgi:glutamine amidotransferase
LFFAHVRATTGTPVTRPNCHPFVCGRWMFMHNGLIGDWKRVRRQVEALIPDELYGSRIGTTDSEAVFLAIMGAGIERDPIAATTRVVARLTELVNVHDEPLRFTAALSNGHDLYAFRYSAHERANSLYYDASGTEIVIVSEPLDATPERWKAVPPGHMVVARAGRPVEIAPFLSELQVAAE